MKTRISIITCAFFFILVQCRSKTKGDTVVVGSTQDTVQEDSLRKLTYLLLSPNDILSEIFSRHIVLNTQLVNTKENAGKYLDSKSQALNLGVYIADFAYLNLNENKTNALDYFKIIRDLAQKNDIYGCFDDDLFSRIQDNLANNDSIVSISREMYYSMSDNLESANRQNVYALVSSGALIESLYLSVMNVTNFNEYREVAQKIFEQKQLFDSFYSFIFLYKTDPEVNSVLIQLERLRKIFNSSPSQQTKIKVTRGNDHHLRVSGGENIIVTERAFEEFKENAIRTRGEIINISTK